MTVSKLETIVILFLCAILVIAIIFAPKDSYVTTDENGTISDETNLPVEISPSVDESIKDTQEETPYEESDLDTSVQSFVGTVIEETTEHMIIEPAVGESEREIAERISVVYPQKHEDYFYGIGRRVIVQYTYANVSQSPDFEIKTDSILTDGYTDFEITVEESKDKHKHLIFTTENIENFDAFSSGNKSNLYYYGVDTVNADVNGETISLADALSKGYITINGILQNCNSGVKDGTVTETRFDDSGSVMFECGSYTVIKYYTVGENGNNDIYICSSGADEDVCNLEVNEADFHVAQNNNGDEWGLTLNVEDASNGVIYYFTQQGGNPTGKLSYGSDYTIEKLVNGEWEKVEYIVDEEVAWTSEAYTIPKNGSTEKMEINFDNLYGELPNGIYRFGKSVIDFKKTGESNTKMYFAHFDIN